jgi:hypothetical protein
MTLPIANQPDKVVTCHDSVAATGKADITSNVSFHFLIHSDSEVLRQEFSTFPPVLMILSLVEK